MILAIFYIILFIIIFFYLFYRFIFMRDPKRKIPKGENIVSPADGKIIEILKIGNKKDNIKIKKGLVGKIYSLTKDIAKECYIISIFMSPLNVHVNRAPVDGKIEKINYKKGKFLPVNTLKRGLVNEKNEIIIKNKKLGKIKVIQIAGFIARRIQCYTKKGDKVKKGQKIGFINLGSQVTLILPKKINLKVKKGQKVKGGSTVIAKY